jgi:hypothetical protein
MLLEQAAVGKGGIVLTRYPSLVAGVEVEQVERVVVGRQLI